MKQFKLFEEFYGNVLWADETYFSFSNTRKSFADYITKMYDTHREKNEYKEDALLGDIERYLQEGDKEIKRNIHLLKILMRYKKLYPEMLDPGQSLKNSDLIYRGMTAPIEQVWKILENSSKIIKLQGNSAVYRKYLICKGANTVIKSRSDMGFISASTSLYTAQSFAGMSGGEFDRWSIVANTKYGAVKDLCLMNPEFLNILNPMDEQETWILGDRFKAQDIYLEVKEPSNYSKQIEKHPEYGKLFKELWKIYTKK